jgi:uncharacterized protein (DUF433 family)
MSREFRIIGHGIYGLSEMARYTDLPQNTVRAWFTSAGAAIFKPTYTQDSRHFAVSFLDLIDVLVVGRLRERGVSMQMIRKVYGAMRTDFGVEHPFSHASILTDGKKVFMQSAKAVKAQAVIEIVSKQNYMETVMKPYLERVDYNSQSSMAERWRILDGVIIDPRVNFGKPTVQGTNTSTYILANAFRANREDASMVANLFEVRREDVVHAVEFERRYGKAA